MSRPTCTSTVTPLHLNGDQLVAERRPTCTSTVRPACTSAVIRLHLNGEQPFSYGCSSSSISLSQEVLKSFRLDLQAVTSEDPHLVPRRGRVTGEGVDVVQADQQLKTRKAQGYETES